MKTKPRQLSRIIRLQRIVKNPFLITGMHSVRYLTGFTGSCGAVLLTPDSALLITDRRYEEQAAVQVPDEFSIIYQDGRLGATVQPWLGEARRLLLEAESVTLAQRDALAESLPGVELEGAASPVLKMRRIKDKGEVRRIEEALRLTEEVMVYAAGIIRPGMRERQLAAMMERYGKSKGAKGASFDFIIASGARSSLPHGEASEKVIGRNEIVMFDFGFALNGYCSDFTRMLFTGKKPPAPLQRAWSLVREAQEIGFSKIRAGESLAAPDTAVRIFFQKNRVLKRYLHSLGHGVGLEIHESPRFSWRSEGDQEPGMVITVEPGLYSRSHFGVRLEDMALVTRKGVRRLTDFPLEIACTG